ncbi:hypothetical protein NB693_25510 [Pantoea ananatis]|nr:hypothetical protein [Pantoea ananatis]
MTVSPSSANEDSGTPFVYTVTLSSTNSSATTVNLTRSGTATSGTDYTGAVSSVVVPANATSASFSVTPVTDTTVEPDETVIFQVANGTGYSIGNLQRHRPSLQRRCAAVALDRRCQRHRRQHDGTATAGSD